MTSSQVSAGLSHELPCAPPRRTWVEILVIFIGALLTFVFLRSHDLTAVDGAVHAFDIFREPRLQFHSSSHMLHPVWVLAWTRAASGLGLSLADPKQFIRVVQVMNSALAAGCCAVLFALVRSLGSQKLGIVAALSWSFSHAVLLHATNAAEPMSGLFFSVCAFAIVIVSVRRGSSGLMIPAGFLLALAMASYQSMVFMGMSCGLVALLWPVNSHERGIGCGLRRTGLLVTSFLVGLVLIYCVCYRLQGVRSVGEARGMFVTVNSMEAYGCFSFSKLVNIPVGLANSIVVAIPREYKGIRWLLATQGSWILRTAISLPIVLLTVAWGLCRKRCNSDPDWLRPFVIACCGTLGLGLLLLLYWDPLYDKLWLQPLWVLSLLVFTTAAVVESPSRVAKGLLTVLIVGCGAINLQQAVNSARGIWPNLDEAARVHATIRPQDFAITEWSSVAMLYRHIWAGDAGSFDFPANTCGRGAAGLRDMETQIAKARARGGEIYFLGTLDLERPAWDSFLGKRCGVPYESLDAYRAQARTVATFRSGGITITMRRADVVSAAIEASR